MNTPEHSPQAERNHFILYTKQQWECIEDQQLSMKIPIELKNNSSVSFFWKSEFSITRNSEYTQRRKWRYLMAWFYLHRSVFDRCSGKAGGERPLHWIVKGWDCKMFLGKWIEPEYIAEYRISSTLPTLIVWVKAEWVEEIWYVRFWSMKSGVIVRLVQFVFWLISIREI